MEQAQVFVYLSRFDLFVLLFLFIGGVCLLVALLGAALRGQKRQSGYKRRLRQIQADKDRAQLELTKLTQDYVQRAKQYARDQQSHQNEERKHTHTNRKWNYQP